MIENIDKRLVCQRCGKKLIKPRDIGVKEFLTRQYCSHKCNYEAIAIRRKINICLNCKMGHYNKNDKYCSNSCYWEYRKLHKPKAICRQCKKEFIILPSRKGIYCSSKCHGLGSRDRIRLTCKQCNNDFERTPGMLRNHSGCKGKFCSTMCSNQWAKDNRILGIRCLKICPVDNKVFKVVKSGAHRTCCSKACGRKWPSIDPSKEDYRIEMAFRQRLRRNAHYSRRRQKIKTIKSDITSKFLRELWDKTNICEECGLIMEEHSTYPLGRHLDHIIPLDCNGKHLQDNVRYIHAICNIKKGKKLKNSQKILST